MIPPEIEARELLITAPISDWLLEVMSTNWLGYWILQLTQADEPTLALLIDLDNLASICGAMRSCIDTARNPEDYPRAETMFVTAASDLPTQTNDKGAVTVMADWSSEPILVLSYYRGGHGEGNVIRQGLALPDAMRVYDVFGKLYNQFPDKQAWTHSLRPSFPGEGLDGRPVRYNAATRIKHERIRREDCRHRAGQHP